MTEENQHWSATLSDTEQQLVEWARGHEIEGVEEHIQDLIITLADQLDLQDSQSTRAFNPRGLLTSLLKQDYQTVFEIFNEQAPTLLAEVVKSRPEAQQQQFRDQYLRPLIEQLQELERSLA